MWRSIWMEDGRGSEEEMLTDDSLDNDEGLAN